MCFWVILLMSENTWKKCLFIILYGCNVNIKSIKFSLCNQLHMGSAWHEYLEFHVESTILNPYLIEGSPNHSCIVTCLDCVSQQSIICTLNDLLSHLWHEMWVIHGWVTLKEFWSPNTAKGYLFRGYLLLRHELNVPYNYLIL